MRMKLQPYQCPSCGYETDRRSNMRKHLYKKSKQCPRVFRDVTLTDEIREHVLENRVYEFQVTTDIQPPQPPPTIVYHTTNHQQINVFNQITNIINSMNAMERLTALLGTRSHQVQLLSLDEKIENLYGGVGNLLCIEDPADPEYVSEHALERDDIYDIIDNIARMNDPSGMDIGMVYDDKVKKLHIRTGDDWQLSRFDQGVKSLIGMLQNNYFDNYECYLVRRILQESNLQARQRCEELLRVYYGFIESFDLKPYVMSGDQQYDDLLSEPQTRERFQVMFTKERRELKKFQRDKYIRDVRDIIVRNSKQNKSEIGKRLLELVRADDDFKLALMTRTSVE